jgi:hypothetical protein
MSLLLACTVGAIMVLAMGSPASADSLFQPIKNVGSNMCLQPENESTAEFAAIVQVPCNGRTAQGWAEPYEGNGRYHLVNQLSGLCLDAFDGAFNGARVLEESCARISNEEWNPGRQLPDVVHLMSRTGNTDTNFCVDVPGAQVISGLAMQLYVCNGTVAQFFTVGLTLP